jgi:hypothetical protein
LSAAVAAATIELAKVGDVERVDDNLKADFSLQLSFENICAYSSTAVVLDDLVLGILSTTVVDTRCAALLLDSNRIFAHILEVDMVKRARAEAVNTLSLVGTDYDVLKRRTLLKEEDCIRVATLSLISACA